MYGSMWLSPDHQGVTSWPEQRDMVIALVYLAVVIFVLVALILNVSLGPFYGRASMIGPPEVRYWADTLLRLAMAGLSLTFLFSGLEEWRGRSGWPRLAG